jgi:pilus assembly protein Flp/PilA
MLRRLIQEEDGQSLVEYGLILGLVSVVLVGALQALQGSLYTVFTQVGVELQKAGLTKRTK